MSAIGMPGHLLALFAPRPAPEYVSVPKKRKRASYSGLADLIEQFESDEPPRVPPFETPKERKKRRKIEKNQAHESALKTQIEAYDPHRDPEGVKTQDPSKTLFVGRLSYEANEKKLLSLFEVFGPVHDIRVVADQNGRPRGYAFVEFERSEDMRLAFREADGKRIEGRRIVLDVERGRTDPQWLPRRLGGGRGPQREGKRKDSVQQVSQLGRQNPPVGFRDRERIPRERQSGDRFRCERNSNYRSTSEVHPSDRSREFRPREGSRDWRGKR